jgi:hypothetical protein
VGHWGSPGLWERVGGYPHFLPHRGNANQPHPNKSFLPPQAAGVRVGFRKTCDFVKTVHSTLIVLNFVEENVILCAGSKEISQIIALGGVLAAEDGGLIR